MPALMARRPRHAFHELPSAAEMAGRHARVNELLASAQLDALVVFGNQVAFHHVRFDGHARLHALEPGPLRA